MWAIVDSVNSKAIEPVLNYLEGVYKKWRQPKCNYAGDAYIDGLIYLSRLMHKTLFLLHQLYVKSLKLSNLLRPA